jgi:WD40 repeat protein
MRFSKFLFALLFSGGVCLAQTQAVYINGIVKDSASFAPLSGVAVEFHRFSCRDTTDAAGAFLFDFTAAVKGIKAQPGTGLTVGRNGSLDITLVRKAVVNVRAYSLNGRLISAVAGTWNPGHYDVPPPVGASGVFLYRICLDGKQYAFRFTSMDNNQAIRSVRRGIVRSPSRENAATLEKNSLSFPAQDSLEFSKEGYYMKKVGVTWNMRNLTVLLKPIVLRGGVRPGRWDLASAWDSMMQVYVNPGGNSVDSIIATVPMHCISTTNGFTFRAAGPFAIPQNGVVAIGDSIKLQFTESTVTGTFYTKQSISMSTSQQCSWSDISYFGGGGYMIQTYTHTNHTFTMWGPVFFTSTYYTLRITANHGKVTKYPDKNSFLPGDTVELSAIPDTLYGFRGWSGVSAVLEGGRAKVGMNSDRTVVADFEPNFSLTIEAQNGSCERYPWESSYAPGDTVKLVARANFQFRFTGWSGAFLRTSADTAWVLMDASKTVAANFGVVYYLFVTGQHGTATASPTREYFLPGQNETVRLIANPDTGFKFMQWNGPTLRVSQDTAWVMMDTTKTIAIEFGPARIRGIFQASQSDQIYALDFSQDGLKVAFALRGVAVIYDKNAGTPIKQLGGEEVIIHDLKYVSNGAQMLLTNWYGYAELWDIASGSKLRTFDGPASGGNSVALSPDGAKVATGDFKRLGLFSIETATQTDSFPGLLGTVKKIVFSLDGAKLAAGSQFDSSRVYDIASKTMITAIPGEGKGFRFSADATLLQTIDYSGMLLTIDLTSRAVLKTVNTGTNPQCADFSPDGSMVAAGTWNRGIKVWSAATGDLLFDFESESPVMAIKFSPDGSEILTGDLDGRALLWNAK